MSSTTDDDIGTRELDQDEGLIDSDMYDELKEENKQLKSRIDELTAFVYVLAEKQETEAFSDSLNIIERQNAARIIKSKIRLTIQQMEIVNKSKEIPQQSVNNQ